MLELEKFPNQPDIMYEAAMLAEKAGKHEVFEQMMRKLIEIEPGNAQAYNALAMVCWSATNVSRGDETGRKGIPACPDDVELLTAWVLGIIAGQFAQESGIFAPCLCANPDPEIAAHLGEVLWAQGEKELAKNCGAMH